MHALEEVGEACHSCFVSAVHGLGQVAPGGVRVVPRDDGRLLQRCLQGHQPAEQPLRRGLSIIYSASGEAHAGCQRFRELTELSRRGHLDQCDGSSEQARDAEATNCSRIRLGYVGEQTEPKKGHCTKP